MRPPRPAHADDLREALAEACRLLARGVADRRHAFHTPTLATLGLDGAPRARTLVLRGCEAATRTLRLHTDRRAGKWAELEAEPRCALHLYDAGAAIQVRLLGRASLHAGDGVADAAWEATRPFSRLIYAVQPAPGSPTAAPPPAPTPAPTPASQDGTGAREHFAAILFRWHRLEWLWLAAEGHRRARFTWDEHAAEAADTAEATWLVP